MAARSRDWSIPKRKRRGNLTSSRDSRAVVLRQRRCERRRGVCRLRDRCARSAELRVRQLRHAQCKRQGCLSPALLPEDADEKTRAFSRATRLALQSDGGAATRCEGDAVVAGPTSPNRPTIPMSFRHRDRRIGIVAASISGAVADAMSYALAIRQKRWCGTVSYSTTPIRMPRIRTAGIEVSVHTEVVREKRTGYNVLAYLPATERSRVAAMGCRSARTTITWGTARAATHWRINIGWRADQRVPTTCFRQCAVLASGCASLASSSA